MLKIPLTAQFNNTTNLSLKSHHRITESQARKNCFCQTGYTAVLLLQRLAAI